MEALGAAQAVFSAIARPLNKYLKLTRQQPRHTADQVVAHLARCLSLRFTAATFLQRFFSPKFPFPVSLYLVCRLIFFTKILVFIVIPLVGRYACLPWF